MKALKFLILLPLSFAFFIACEKNNTLQIPTTDDLKTELNSPIDHSNDTEITDRSGICTVTLSVTSTLGSSIRVCGVVNPPNPITCTNTGTCGDTGVGTVGIEFGPGPPKINSFDVGCNRPFQVTNTGATNTITIELNGGNSTTLAPGASAVFVAGTGCAITAC